jgi:hypothetical protein
MDSKLIFQTSQHLKLKVKWNMLTNTEWAYFGVGEEINKECIKTIIEEYIDDYKIVIAYTRQDSFETDKGQLLKSIESILSNHDFFLWDSKFKKVIEFNHIGVFRKGSVA